MLLVVYAMSHHSPEKKNLYDKYKIELAVEITDAPAMFKFM